MTSGTLRCHYLSTGDVLSRRVLTELFQEAAGRLRTVYGTAFGDGAFPRSRFQLDSFVEMEASADTVQYLVPDHGHLLPGSLDPVSDDSDLVVQWSIAARCMATFGYLLYVWPVVNGVSCFHLGDQATADQIFESTHATDPSQVAAYTGGAFIPGNILSLGNHGGVSVRSRGYTGLLALSIAQFRVTQVQLQVYRRVR